MTQIAVQILKIVNGGYGFGKLDNGQVIFVRHALPDEFLYVTISENKKNLLYGKAAKIIEPHPQRREPPCPYYENCGGCDFQHCHYTLQTAIKKSLIEDLLARLGSNAVRKAAHLLQPVLSAPEEFHYRQRIQLKTGARGKLGFHRFRSNEVVYIESCLLAPDKINDCIKFLSSDAIAQKMIDLSSGVDLLLNPADDCAAAVFQFSRKPRPADINAALQISRISSPISQVYLAGDNFSLLGPFSQSDAQKAGEQNQMQVTYPDLFGTTVNLAWEVGGFCQVNLMQNRKMIETVLQFCSVKAGDTVLDLFCGMGNFSIPLALQGALVEGYEGQGSAVRSARRNSMNSGVPEAQFFKLPVNEACRKLVQQGRNFDTVVIDPPRHGGPELAANLFKLTRQRLVYVSCDPATLCRDLNDLTSEGFKIRRLQPVDMFPQTHHVELIALLEK